MTRDEVISMARAAGASTPRSIWPPTLAMHIDFTPAALERFYTLVEAKTKEAAYKAGWIAAAKWADRADLIADIDSPAYIAERHAAIHTSKGAS